MARRAGPPCRLALLAVLALAACSAAPAAAELHTPSGGRKLLQPFTLPIGKADRTKANAGRVREGLSNGVTNIATVASADTSPKVNNSITAQSSQSTLSTNLNLGGAVKNNYQARAATDREGAATDSFTETRSISQPGAGMTVSYARDSSTSISQRRTVPAGPVREGVKRPKFAGPEDNRPLGSWDVLTATTTDYGWAGDYDYTLVKNTIGKPGFTIYGLSYDYGDYGQPRPIPETATVATRTRTRLDDKAGGGRGASFGRAATVATAPAAVARSRVMSSGMHGITSARKNDDVFGTNDVFIPIEPFRATSTGAGGVALGRSYKGSLRPSIAFNAGNAGNTISRNYVSGGSADQLNYVSGTKSSVVRSENIALGGQENLDFDVAGRRRRAAARRRLLQTQHVGQPRAAAGSQ